MNPRDRLTSPAALADLGLVARAELPALERVAERYAVALTRALAERIDPSDPADPLRRQFVPSAAELESAPGELADPIGDAAHSPVKGIVHRYPDRVLLKPSHACPTYCRFCFRREQVGPGGEALSPDELATALDYVAAHAEIFEVILSGGDPLVLAPRRLAAIVARLESIPHVRVIRVHTRVPVVDPERVSAELVAALRSTKAVWVVVHANHVRELDPAARAACARFIDAGIPMLAQTVLLAGVNDEPSALEDLLRELVANRVKPYYLHHADLAPGTAHFRTPIARGREIVKGLRGRVSGLCQPTYVLDIPGGHGKVPIGPAYATERDGDWIVEDPTGHVHVYRG